MKKQATIISSYYQKGGNGKTTFAVNFAAFLSTLRRSRYSRYKNRVLILDFDSQCSSTQYLDCYDETRDSVYDALRGAVDIRDIIIPLKYNYWNHRECQIDLAPSSEMLHNSSEMIKDFTFQEDQLGFILSKVIFDYDYIIIDCPPQSDSLFKNIFNVTDYYILVTSAESESEYYRLPQTISMIKDLTTNGNQGDILGICFNKYNPNRIVNAETGLTSEGLVERYKKHLPVFDQKILTSEGVSSSFSNHLPIPFYYSNTQKYGRVYYAYAHLTKEIINRINQLSVDKKG